MVSQAFVGKAVSWIDNGGAFSERRLTEISVGAAGVAFLAVMAQVALPLPFTPVPLTGQTLAVSLLALTLGRRLALPTLLAYLGLGSAGLPIFAAGQTGFGGPSFGYLVGMLLSAYVVGGLADRGFGKTFKKALFASVLSDLCVFTVGLIGLSFYIPAKGLLIAGVLPFIPGQIIKAILAASLVSKLSSKEA